ncbi:MAG: ATP-binding cassette domain-containing protein [Chloroflexaceae bacterium]|nr:ATP-binding cassette domain-containing protein [Chloroflexaceae bacterium]
MTTLAIEAHSLGKHYKEATALSDLSLQVEPQQIYALLGPNGAGKTTTLSILTTLLPPSSGTARVAGFDVVQQAHEVRRRIGVTFQEIVLDRDLTGRQVLDIHGQLYRLGKAERTRQISELVALVQLEDAIDRGVKTYSGGMKRRLELARGLMTKPEILFLDEPTQGLDPQNRAGIWDYIRTLNREHNLTVLLTTHYMEEAEALAHRVGIIDHGTMVAEGTPAGLVASIGTELIRMQGSGDTAHFINTITTLPFVLRVDQDQQQGAIQIYVDNSTRRLLDVVQMAGSNGMRVDDISIARPTLGDAFLHYTGRGLRDS